MLLPVGKKAPGFHLRDESGHLRTLREFAGKYLVLYFYPKDLTPGCTLEAYQFQRHLAAIRQAGAEVAGVSCDPFEKHRKFSNLCGLEFALLSDVRGKTVRQYGVWQEKQIFGRKFLGIARVTYLIDPQGKIAKVYAKVSPKSHAAAVLTDVQAFAATGAGPALVIKTGKSAKN